MPKPLIIILNKGVWLKKVRVFEKFLLASFFKVESVDFLLKGKLLKIKNVYF